MADKDAKTNQKPEGQLSLIERNEMVYEVNGEEIKLTGAIVKKFLSRGNKELTDAETFMFMSLCKFQKLNPFLNEAYAIKFGDECQLVVGKEAYMKRADSSEKLDGHEAGLILERDGNLIEVEGSFLMPKDTLLGGWAIVHRSDKKFPIIIKVSFKEYDKGQSVWKTKPATMIRKVALVQALREAFPENLGGMYVEDELPEIDHEKVVAGKIKDKANKEVIDIKSDDIIDIVENAQAPGKSQPKQESEKKTAASQMSIDGDPY
jgi:phage recombination protein Bet